MEITSEVVMIVGALLVLGIVVAVIMYLSYTGGTAVILELIKGFFRGA